MIEQERQEFGAYIKRLREERQLSLREVEKAVGISNSYLYQIERGERNPPKPEILKKMAALYNVGFASMMAAAKLHENSDDAFFEANDLERAFDYVRRDPRFKFGTHMNGDVLTPEAKRFIVEVYEAGMNVQLLRRTDEGKGKGE